MTSLSTLHFHFIYYLSVSAKVKNFSINGQLKFLQELFLFFICTSTKSFKEQYYFSQSGFVPATLYFVLSSCVKYSKTTCTSSVQQTEVLGKNTFDSLLRVERGAPGGTLCSFSRSTTFRTTQRRSDNIKQTFSSAGINMISGQIDQL